MLKPFKIALAFILYVWYYHIKEWKHYGEEAKEVLYWVFVGNNILFGLLGLFLLPSLSLFLGSITLLIYKWNWFFIIKKESKDRLSDAQFDSVASYGISQGYDHLYKKGYSDREKIVECRKVVASSLENLDKHAEQVCTYEASFEMGFHDSPFGIEQMGGYERSGDMVFDGRLYNQYEKAYRKFLFSD